MGATSPRRGWLGRLAAVAGAAPTACVLAGLAGIGYWGHHTGWRYAAPPPVVAAGGPGTEPTTLTAVHLDLGDPGGQSPVSGRRVRLVFASPGAAEAVGVEATPSWESPVIETVSAAGEVEFDPARVARVSARAPGAVWRVFKAVGDPVRSGDLLALVDAAEVGRIKAELLQAASLTRARRQARDDLRAAGAVIPEPQLREADAAVRDAEARLLGAEQGLANLGLPDRAADLPAVPLAEIVERIRLLGVPERVPGLDPDTAPDTLVPVRAPLDGVVLAAAVVAGEAAAAGQVLFTLVDARRVWVTLHVPVADARRVAVGQPVRFRPDGSTGEAAGTVGWVGTAADGPTRTVPVRAELDNPGGRLRAATPGRGRVVLGERPDAVVVPPDAVRSFRGTPVVFVRDPAFLKPGGPAAFYPRAVRTGAADDRQVEVTAGLGRGEVVATKGSDLLHGELLRAVAGGGR